MWRGELCEGIFGDLSIFEMPLPDTQYAVGVDTSSGLRSSKDRGDPSAAEVIEMKSGRQVAEMHGFRDPTQWGYASARLAGFYNMAPLAIETHPSQHGLTAFLAAERYAYPKLYVQTRLDRAGALVEKRGWVMHQQSKWAMMDRIRAALQEGIIIRSTRLLDELGAVHYENQKFVSDEHDDCIVAYGIALMLRDQAYRKGEIRMAKSEPMDLDAAYWKRQSSPVQDRDRFAAIAAEREFDDVWDGV